MSLGFFVFDFLFFLIMIYSCIKFIYIFRVMKKFFAGIVLFIFSFINLHNIVDAFHMEEMQKMMQSWKMTQDMKSMECCKKMMNTHKKSTNCMIHHKDIISNNVNTPKLKINSYTKNKFILSYDNTFKKEIISKYLKKIDSPPNVKSYFIESYIWIIKDQE